MTRNGFLFSFFSLFFCPGLEIFFFCAKSVFDYALHESFSVKKCKRCSPESIAGVRRRCLAPAVKLRKIYQYFGCTGVGFLLRSLSSPNSPRSPSLRRKHGKWGLRCKIILKSEIFELTLYPPIFSHSTFCRVTGNCLLSALNSPSLSLANPWFKSFWYLPSRLAIALTISVAVALEVDIDDRDDGDGEIVVGLMDFRVVRRTLPSS